MPAENVEDKVVDADRYDARASVRLAGYDAGPAILGSRSVPIYLSSPYVYFEEAVRSVVGKGMEALELGAGEGGHTLALVRAGARVTASDISPRALELLKRRIAAAGGEVTTRVADIENLPFPPESFDVVTCAGSLSYGDIERVSGEVERVLRPGGCLICVDSLNHNPIYRFNRWLQCRRGSRTVSTYSRIPTMAGIARLGRDFEAVDVRYFGAFSFAMPVLAKMVGASSAKSISDDLDRIVGVRGSAFKFVLTARGLRK